MPPPPPFFGVVVAFASTSRLEDCKAAAVLDFQMAKRKRLESSMYICSAQPIFEAPIIAARVFARNAVGNKVPSKQQSLVALVSVVQAFQKFVDQVED